jgi:dTMP kinase
VRGRGDHRVRATDPAKGVAHRLVRLGGVSERDHELAREIGVRVGEQEVCDEVGALGIVLGELARGLGSLGDVDRRVFEEVAQQLEGRLVVAASNRADGSSSDAGVLLSTLGDRPGDLGKRPQRGLVALATLGHARERGLADLGPGMFLARSDPTMVGRELGEAVAERGEARCLGIEQIELRDQRRGALGRNGFERERDEDLGRLRAGQRGLGLLADQSLEHVGAEAEPGEPVERGDADLKRDVGRRDQRLESRGEAIVDVTAGRTQNQQLRVPDILFVFGVGIEPGVDARGDRRPVTRVGTRASDDGAAQRVLQLARAAPDHGHQLGELGAGGQLDEHLEQLGAVLVAQLAVTDEADQHVGGRGALLAQQLKPQLGGSILQHRAAQLIAEHREVFGPAERGEHVEQAIALLGPRWRDGVEPSDHGLGRECGMLFQPRAGIEVGLATIDEDRLDVGLRGRELVGLRRCGRSFGGRSLASRRGEQRKQQSEAEHQGIVAYLRSCALAPMAHHGMLPHSFNMPRVIAFEGVDGAGKSTVLELVANHLRSSGVAVCLPRLGKEHASKPIREIRQLTRDRTNLDLFARTELLLYAAREAQVLEQMVRPALAEGATVLLDRSMLTPIVLGSYGRGLELRMCEAIAREASAGLGPDLTLIFDVDARTSRIRKRLDKVRTDEIGKSGRKGLAGSGLSERVREGYLSLAARDGLPVLHCERGTAPEIAARVIAKLETGSFEEDAESATPWWRVDPELDFEQAVESLPTLLQLYFTRSLPLGRAVRSELFEQEAALAIWACDLDDPLLTHALEHAPERVLERLGRRGASSAGSRLEVLASLREQLLTTHPDVVARSLTGIFGEQADRMRARLAELAPGAVLESLAGRSDAFALELRERLWKQAKMHERVACLSRCDDPDAWRRRERLLERDPAIVLPTLGGLEPARVDPILARYLERAPKSVLSALFGRADASAHQLRARLIETGRELIDSISGLDDADSWALRESMCERWPSTVASSLVGMPLGDRAQVLLARCREAAPNDLFLKRRLALLARPQQLGEDRDD